VGIGASGVLAALMVGVGLAALVVGVLLRARSRGESLAQLLALVGGDLDVPVEAVTESPAAPPVSKVTARLGDALGRLDTRGSLARIMARADIPLRPGEFLFLSGAATVIFGALGAVLSGSWLIGVIVAAVIAYGCRAYLMRRANKRKELLRSQLPDAFSLIASSVASGHTFLRSIQLLREQIASPLAGELDRTVAEVALGSNLIDALDRMAMRTEIEDLRWAVQAVRIQQTTGGMLAELLHTLADFMRAREEVHREVIVLTAEGRFSGWVLMALPFLAGIGLLFSAHGYLNPFFRGWGWFWLGLCVALLTAGYVTIRNLVQIEV
jgi:tight adherence protein B